MSNRGPTAAAESRQALWARARGVLLLLMAWLLTTPTPARPDAPRLDRLEHFTTRDGLSANWILSIYQDSQGYLWVGTDDGLNRYDGYGFKVFRHDPDDPSSLSDNFVICIYEDSQGQIWFGTRAGLNRLDRASGAFTRFRHDPEQADSLSADFVPDIQEDRHGVLWVATFDGLNRFDRSTQSFTHFRHDPEDPGSLSTNAVIRIHESEAGDLWFAAGDGVLHRLDREAQRFVRYQLTTDEEAFIWRFVEDTEGLLWIAVRPGARLFRFDPRTGETKEIPIDLKVNKIESLLPKPDGTLWIGTPEGLAIFDPVTATYAFATHDPDDPGSLSHDRVMRLYEDRTRVTWLGTEQGLDKFVPSRERFTLFDHRPGDRESLSDDNVSAVVADRDGVLWIGTGTGLNQLNRARGVNIRHRHVAGDPKSLASDEIWSLLVDRRDRLWIGLRNGLDRFDPESGRFLRQGPGSDDPGGLLGRVQGMVEDPDDTLWFIDDASLHHLDTEGRPLGRYPVLDEADTPLHGQPALLQDRRGDLWIGSDFFGLIRFDPRREIFHRYRHDPNDPTSLSYDKILSLHQDSSGILWIGTHGGGLNRFDPSSPNHSTFTRYGQQDGLESEQIVGIQEDDLGNLWLSTSKGLACFDPTRQTFQSFDAADGPGQDAFSWGAAWRGDGGELFFGGIGGLTAFFPTGFESDPHPPQVAITDFLLFNRSTPLADYSPTGATGDIPSILLTHREYVFAFEFAALHFTRPDKIRYAYQLEGFDRDWVTADPGRRFAQYSNLTPGDYLFRVKAANPDGVWNPDGASVRITVLPPPWKSWWAYGLYGLALAAGVLGYVRSQQRKLRRERQATERERVVSARLREVDKIKDEFLANTSHELRTPLYGITGLAESLIDGARGEAPEALKKDLAMIVASGRRLSHLVGDILDFSKMRHKNLALDRHPLDLRPLVDVVLTLSRPLVGDKPVELKNSVPTDLPAVDADENRLQQILHNLVGNAVKFTATGNVEVSADHRDGQLSVRVSDTGIGIPRDKQEAIFDAFEQADASTERQFGGTGLGLAVTRQLVELHGGTLGVESAPDEGSTFSFSLPVAEREAPPVARESITIPAAIEPVATGPSATAITNEASQGESGSGHILVVDDEPVNRQVLINQLTTAGFQVSQAASGPEALSLVDEQVPDLVLLDVMMPRMSGYEVCRTLRQHYPLDHLPVLFLTAKSQPSDLVVGLAAGANDYLPKPVAKSELLARVETHLALRDVHRRLALLVAERTSQLSERGRLLEERERLISQLEASNAELARFNYTVAHDLRNPLVTIKTFIGRLQRDAEEGGDDRLQHDLQRIGVAADKLHRLLDELYAFSRVSRPLMSCEDVAIGELTSEILSEFTDQVAERRAKVEIATDLPVVCGDRARLAEVVRHLLANALGYLGDQSAPRIEVGARKTEAETVIFVRDNGQGIDPRYHEKVFELFQRLNPEASDGTGIGLALAKRIVEVHGGRAWVESEGEGRGSTFCFALPS